MDVDRIGSRHVTPLSMADRRPRCGWSTAASGRNGAVRPGTPVWTPLWISNPHPSVGGMAVCGLCRALTPPEHDEVLGRGQGPAQEAVGEGTRTGVDEKQWRTRKTEKQWRQKGSEDRAERTRESRRAVAGPAV